MLTFNLTYSNKTVNRQPSTVNHMMLRYSLFLLIIFISSCNTESDPYQAWKVVNGNGSGNKFSSLSEVDTSNVTQLKVAWTYHTEDVDTAAHSQIQCNPIIINGTLYGTSPQLKLFALDACHRKRKMAL